MKTTTPAPRWVRVRHLEHEVVYDGKRYRLCKSGEGWYLHAEREGVEFDNAGGLTELIKPGTGPGFFTEGFGRTLKQAKANTGLWLTRGVTFNDNEWIL